MAECSVVLMLLVFSGNYCSTLADVITWPREYHFKVDVVNIDTHLETSMEIWFSSIYNRSCIENYGIKKTYYAPNTFPHMVLTNEGGENGTVCIQNSFDDIYASALNFLPNSSIFGDTGESIYLDDRSVDIWTAQDNVHGAWWTKETLYVIKTIKGVHIPVRHKYKLYNVINGSILKHQIGKFYNFNENITEEDVIVVDAKSCKYMFEYVHRPRDSFRFLHPDVPSDLNAAFGRYKSIYKKNYHPAEHAIKKRIFEKNWRMIVDHNKNNLTYTLRINELADETDEVFDYLTAYPFTHPGKYFQPFPHSPEEVQELVKQLPENFDLRMEGVIGAVKNQGKFCRSCWAFVVTAAVEGVIARRLAGSRLLHLSEQSLIDCSWQYRVFGCLGGWLGPAFDYVLENGIPIASDYPYKDGDGKCNINEIENRFYISKYVLVPPGDHEAMKLAIYKYGPVAVTIRADTEFRYYSAGILKSRMPYTTCLNVTINHAVALVGYGVRDGKEYWIAKNSAGQEWGEDGYILLSAADDNCFLTLKEPYYPVL